MNEVFFLIEFFHVGLLLLLDALTSLVAGRAAELQEILCILNEKKAVKVEYCLRVFSLNKSYFPKDRVENPSK
jgi:hypothetical protein